MHLNRALAWLHMGDFERRVAGIRMASQMPRVRDSPDRGAALGR